MPMLTRFFRLSPGAILIVVGVTACAENAPQQGASPITCADFNLSASSPNVELTGETPTWLIGNKGPATVVVRTTGDPSFAMEIPPMTDDDPPTMFFGDAEYQYTLGLANGRGTAEVRFCY
jgi:hypothetical protein